MNLPMMIMKCPLLMMERTRKYKKPYKQVWVWVSKEQVLVLEYQEQVEELNNNSNQLFMMMMMR
jgi:hypothetical protein